MQFLAEFEDGIVIGIVVPVQYDLTPPAASFSALNRLNSIFVLELLK